MTRYMRHVAMAAELGIDQATLHRYVDSGNVPVIHTEDGGRFYEVEATKAAIEEWRNNKAPMKTRNIQVYLTPEQDDFLRRTASEQGLKATAVVRSWIDAEMAKGAA